MFGAAESSHWTPPLSVFGGITLAVRIGDFPNSGPWIGLFVFITFVTGTLVLGWVFEAFAGRRWQAFFAIIFLGNGAYLAYEVAAAGMTIPSTSAIIVPILAVMVVLTVVGFGFLIPSVR